MSTDQINSIHNRRRINKVKLSRDILKTAFTRNLVFLLVLLTFNCSKVGDESNNNEGEDSMQNGEDSIQNRNENTRYILKITPPVCGTITVGRGINCRGNSKACSADFEKGKSVSVTLTAMADAGFETGGWGGACQGSGKTTCEITMDRNKIVSKVFTLSAGASDGDNDCIPNDIDTDDDNDGVNDDADVDDNNDGLIEVHNLDMFGHIRHNLAGTSYKMGSTATANTQGAPTDATVNCKTATDGVYLCGYELMRDLDFAQGDSYAEGSVNTDWRPNDTTDATGNLTTPDNAVNPGFDGIGLSFTKSGGSIGLVDPIMLIDNTFNAIFEGNGHTISNLYSRNTNNTTGASVGLFKNIGTSAKIRNLGVLDANLYGSTAGNDNIGALVGDQYGGPITTSYATGGTINGDDGDDNVGGLVGYAHGSSMKFSYATGTVNGGGGNDRVGGLVGRNGILRIIFLSIKSETLASFATGNANGGDGNDYVGGLVGHTTSGAITASYAIGNTNGGAGDDHVGGLMGYDDKPRKNSDSRMIMASYATGDVNGGVGSDNVGRLSGYKENRILYSYGFGTKRDGENPGNDGTAHPSGATDNVNALTIGTGGNTDVDASWNDSYWDTLGIWDFGNDSQPPALRYANFNGKGFLGRKFSCAKLFPATIPGTGIDLECGKSLLPGQGR